MLENEAITSNATNGSRVVPTPPYERPLAESPLDRIDPLDASGIDLLNEIDISPPTEAEFLLDLEKMPSGDKFIEANLYRSQPSQPSNSERFDLPIDNIVGFGGDLTMPRSDYPLINGGIVKENIPGDVLRFVNLKICGENFPEYFLFHPQRLYVVPSVLANVASNTLSALQSHNYTQEQTERLASKKRQELYDADRGQKLAELNKTYAKSLRRWHLYHGQLLEALQYQIDSSLSSAAQHLAALVTSLQKEKVLVSTSDIFQARALAQKDFQKRGVSKLDLAQTRQSFGGTIDPRPTYEEAQNQAVTNNADFFLDLTEASSLSEKAQTLIAVQQAIVTFAKAALICLVRPGQFSFAGEAVVMGNNPNKRFGPDISQPFVTHITPELLDTISLRKIQLNHTLREIDQPWQLYFDTHQGAGVLTQANTVQGFHSHTGQTFLSPFFKKIEEKMLEMHTITPQLLQQRSLLLYITKYLEIGFHALSLLSQAQQSGNSDTIAKDLNQLKVQAKKLVASPGEVLASLAVPSQIQPGEGMQTALLASLVAETWDHDIKNNPRAKRTETRSYSPATTHSAFTEATNTSYDLQEAQKRKPAYSIKSVSFPEWRGEKAGVVRQLVIPPFLVEVSQVVKQNPTARLRDDQLEAQTAGKPTDTLPTSDRATHYLRTDQDGLLPAFDEFFIPCLYGCKPTEVIVQTPDGQHKFGQHELEQTASGDWYISLPENLRGEYYSVILFKYQHQLSMQSERACEPFSDQATKNLIRLIDQLQHHPKLAHLAKNLETCLQPDPATLQAHVTLEKLHRAILQSSQYEFSFVSRPALKWETMLDDLAEYVHPVSGKFHFVCGTYYLFATWLLTNVLKDESDVGITSIIGYATYQQGQTDFTESHINQSMSHRGVIISKGDREFLLARTPESLQKEMADSAQNPSPINKAQQSPEKNPEENPHNDNSSDRSASAKEKNRYVTLFETEKNTLLSELKKVLGNNDKVVAATFADRKAPLPLWIDILNQLAQQSGHDRAKTIYDFEQHLHHWGIFLNLAGATKKAMGANDFGENPLLFQMLTTSLERTKKLL